MSCSWLEYDICLTLWAACQFHERDAHELRLGAWLGMAGDGSGPGMDGGGRGRLGTRGAAGDGRWPGTIEGDDGARTMCTHVYRAVVYAYFY